MRPVEAEPVDKLPTGDGWLYEPKYDGFRCIAFKTKGEVYLQSKNQKPLGRYFPELVEAFRAVPAMEFTLDGEIMLRSGGFETLQLRLHPAPKRIALLAAEHPAKFVAFDMISSENGPLLEDPFAERRAALEEFFRRFGKNSRHLEISRKTTSLTTAKRWLGRAGLDGIVAKRADFPYRPGARDMRKYKIWTTVDCVVGGIYWASDGKRVDSLLLGLYDEDGKLHYVGRSRVHQNARELGDELQPLLDGEGFTGRAPGGKSRWTGKNRRPVPLDPVLVAEVSADHITGGYMRHGARLLRWRPDKDPRDCTMDQIDRP